MSSSTIIPPDGIGNPKPQNLTQTHLLTHGRNQVAIHITNSRHRRLCLISTKQFEFELAIRIVWVGHHFNNIEEVCLYISHNRTKRSACCLCYSEKTTRRKRRGEAKRDTHSTTSRPILSVRDRRSHSHKLFPSGRITQRVQRHGRERTDHFVRIEFVPFSARNKTARQRTARKGENKSKKVSEARMSASCASHDVRVRRGVVWMWMGTRTRALARLYHLRTARSNHDGTWPYSDRLSAGIPDQEVGSAKRKGVKTRKNTPRTAN